jgi:hypothetical protein
MKKPRSILVALGLLAAASGAFAQPYAPQEFDFSELARIGTNAGIVESAREVPVARDLHGFDPGVLEHKIRPDTVDELVIRLEGGSLITVMHGDDMQRLQPGQRVRVTLTTIGPLVEAQ